MRGLGKNCMNGDGQSPPVPHGQTSRLLERIGLRADSLKKLILEAIEFAGKYTKISEEDKILILNGSKALLYHKGQAWVKKGKYIIDIAMGGLKGAEITDLVGLYILSKLNEIPDIKVGLYRDDGAALSKLSPKEAEKTKN